MSQTELLEASGPWWAPLLGALIIAAYIAVFITGCWAVTHASLLFRLAMARVRAARHSRLYHLTFKEPVR